jgi:alpha-tubulin suppressor-like RCC1 family protein
LDDVIFVDAFRNTVIAIKNDNTLWMWGHDVRKAFTNDFVTSPILIMNNIQKAVVGDSCVIILDNNNQVYGFGRFSFLGLGDRGPSAWTEIPQLILSDIKDIVATRQSMFALNHDSELFGWGVHGYRELDGAGGFLGIGINESWIYSPVLIHNNVKKIFSGYMFIDNDDSLWICGSIASTYGFRSTVDGQGRSTGGMIIDSTMIVYGNSPVKILENVILACGSGFHNMAVDKDGNLYTWGNNHFGQLGNGTVSIFGIKYIDNWTGEETNPGEGERSIPFFYDNSVLTPSKINIF